MTALNSERLEKAWRFDIQYGPDGEANYAWVYNGKDLVATMRTHHADSIVEAMNRRAPLSALPGEAEVVGWAYRGPRGGLIVTEGKPEHAPEAIPLVTLASLQAMQAWAEKAEAREKAWHAQLTHAERDRDFNETCRASWQARAEAAEARVKVLEEALEPFATFTEKRDDNPDMPDSFPIVSYALDLRGDIIRVTLGAFRRARTALKGGSNG